MRGKHWIMTAALAVLVVRQRQASHSRARSPVGDRCSPVSRSRNASPSFGSAMHIFLIDLPRLDCAAIIPKGDVLTVCLLGRDIDKELITAFFTSPAVKRCFGEETEIGEGEGAVSILAWPYYAEDGTFTVFEAGAKTSEVAAKNPPLKERVAATPAIAPPTADVTMYTRCGFAPMSAIAPRSCETARMAVPM